LRTIGLFDRVATVRDDRQSSFVLDLLTRCLTVIGLVGGHDERRSRRDPRREIPTRSKSLRISNAGDQSGGQRGTHAGNLIQSLARLIGSMTGNNLTVEVEDLRFQRPQLGAESKEAGPGNLRQPLVAYIGDHIEQLFNAITSDRCDNAKLSKMGTDRIDHRRLLANE